VTADSPTTAEPHSPIAPHKPSKGDLREASILDAAWELLLTKPLSSITINDLTRGTAITRSTFYFYFESKDAVVRALARRVADDIRSATQGFALGPDDTFTDLRSAIAGYIERWRASGPALRAMGDHAEHDDELRTFWTEITDGILADVARTIDHGRRTGTLAGGPPEPLDLARALFAMLLTIARDHSAREGSAEEARHLVDTLTVVFERSLGVTPPR
jgi:AcrR family transcriptional regulator